MGALAGPLTVAKFTVRGELTDDFHTTFLKAIRHRAFKPLTPDEEAEERIGWCAVGSPLDAELSHDAVFYNSYLNLGLRIDKWRLPATLLKAELNDAIAERLQKTGKERLGKTEKDELKDRIATRLKKRILPSMRHFDLVWNLDSMVLWFWSQSQKTQEQLSVLFEQTFGLELVLHSPYVAATALDLTESEAQALSTVEATPFHAAKKAERERARDKTRAEDRAQAEEEE
ncbi:MAG: recombination-associated protein RdgC [Polyangiaceae bacterium]|nr:recombination-associated protein RdgC [Polyangiaceae bacterium]